ncbi:hypothetical protein J4405_00330 [Candidatus Woesearchaeota archaeon]|nr:hypothetical protein [Candidatus Woesearchaeota archaeon]
MRKEKSPVEIEINLRNRILNDNLGIAGGAFAALTAGTCAYLWNLMDKLNGTRLMVDFQSLYPGLPDIDYDKVFLYTLCAITAMGAYTVANSIRDIRQCRQEIKSPYD